MKSNLSTGETYSDGSDLPPELGNLQPAEPMGGGNEAAEQCVKLKALAMPDEGEQMQPPAVGDRVTYTVEGTVTRVEGEDAYVKPETVNGEPVTETPEEEAAEGQGDEMASLTDQANAMGGM